jgi:hypothetical protein
MGCLSNSPARHHSSTVGTAGIQANDDAEADIVHLQGKLQADIALQKGSGVNPPDTFRLLFDQIADGHFAEMVDSF